MILKDNTELKCEHCGEKNNIDYADWVGKYEIICYECLNTTIIQKKFVKDAKENK